MRKPVARTPSPLLLASYQNAAAGRVAPDESDKAQHDLLGRYRLRPDQFPAMNELAGIHIKAREFMINGNMYEPMLFGKPFTSHDIAGSLVKIGPYYGLIMTHTTKPNIFIAVDHRGLITATTVMALNNFLAHDEKLRSRP